MGASTAFIEQLYPSEDEILWRELKDFQYGGVVFVLSYGKTIEDITHLIIKNQVKEVETLIELGKIYKPKSEQVKEWDLRPEQLFKYIYIKPYIIVQEFNPRLQ